MVLRPKGQAVVNAALRATVFAVPGLLLLYAAWSSGAISPAILGAATLLLGLLIFVNSAVARIQLESGILSASTLLGRRQVRVDQITKVVPIDLRYRRTVFTRWNRAARMFEVRTREAPVGFWLNPHVYGEHEVEQLLRAMGIEPDGGVEDRVVDPLRPGR